MSQTIDRDALLRFLGGLSDAELQGVDAHVASFGESLKINDPKTDDELWNWIRTETGFEISRTAVCEGHCAPFDFLSDLYFRRSTSAILVANRGGSKTFLVALLHYCNGRLRSGIESATVGATEAQGQRCHAHLKNLIGLDKVKAMTSRCTPRLIAFRTTGSQTEVLPGTEKAVNGIHPHILHADEVEQMDGATFAESRNCSQAGLVDGVWVPAQDIITSTRKRGAGPMQALIDQVNTARLQNVQAPYDLYTWCIFETAQQVENCQCARPDLPEEERCACNHLVKGTWEETETATEPARPRTLKDVCRGRLYRSRGFLPYEHVAKKFMENSRGVWEAQQTCEKPSLEGLVWPQWSRDRHGLTSFEVDPDNGPIYQGIDFGGSNPHAVVYVQLLRVEVEVTNQAGARIRLKEGTRVAFHEIYLAGIGNTALANLMGEADRVFEQYHRGFHITARFADPQAKAAKLDLRDAGQPCVWFGATRDIKEQVKHVSERLDDNGIYVVLSRCPHLVEEIESYHYPKQRTGFTDDPELPVDDFNHAISALRYCNENLDMLERKPGRHNAPSAGHGHYQINDGAPVRAPSLPSVVGRPGEAGTGDDGWRRRFLGGPERTAEPWRR